MRRPLRRDGHLGVAGTEGFMPVTVTTFLIVCGYASLTPVLPLFGSSLGLRAMQVGIVIGSFGFARFMLDLLGGVLGDRFGFRRVAVAGCVTVAFGAFLSAASTTYGQLVGAQLLTGVGSALYTTSAFTVVIMMADPDKKARLLSVYHGAVLIAFSVGPALGGVLGGLLGLRVPFLLYGSLAAVCAVLSLRTVPARVTTDTPSEGTTSPLAALAYLLRAPAFLVSLLVITAGYAVRTGVRNTMVPMFGATELGMAVTLVGAVLAGAVLTNAAVLPHAGSSLDRWGRRPITIASTAGTGVALVLLALVATPWQLVGAVGVLGAVSAYAGLAPVAILSDVVDPAAPGVGVGLQRMGIDLGMMLGPPLAGVGIQQFGFRPTFLAFALLMFVVSALSMFGPETVARPDER